ncbi:hypothetical protein HPB49_007465 [Dermacentor silvarum]|uniref:Uncharacterized protein n=1 Tax=Dermacentor silvarum TaxID=543639 RepID=A0ACB8C2H9_DERSI|nr:hypothetical protein HPB49_007465 [Dermacentor silvarum]
MAGTRPVQLPVEAVDQTAARPAGAFFATAVTDVELPDSADDSTVTEMDSDSSSFTPVESRRLKRKLRRTSTAESDKEGSFVVIPEPVYLDKAHTALKKNFVPASVMCSKIMKKCPGHHKTCAFHTCQARREEGTSQDAIAKREASSRCPRNLLSNTKNVQGVERSFVQAARTKPAVSFYGVLPTSSELLVVSAGMNSQGTTPTGGILQPIEARGPSLQTSASVIVPAISADNEAQTVNHDANSMAICADQETATDAEPIRTARAIAAESGSGRIELEPSADAARAPMMLPIIWPGTVTGGGVGARTVAFQPGNATPRVGLAMISGVCYIKHADNISVWSIHNDLQRQEFALQEAFITTEWYQSMGVAVEDTLHVVCEQLGLPMASEHAYPTAPT